MRLPSTVASFRCIPITKNENDSLKRFPKGACFAFSGVFFLLTLVVLFQSAEPFGVAAIVAYFSSLSLTILLFSAPYFASYFINYYRKLHQIEEAILLISEHRSVGPSPDQKPIPPYSAVSVIESHDPESDSDPRAFQEIDADSTILEDEPPHLTPPASSTLSSEASNDTQESENRIEDSPSTKRVSRRESMLKSQDEFQLSLFDTPSSPASEDQLHDASNGDDSTEAESRKPLTEIQAYCLLDNGSGLFLRGDPPFSWDEGTPMQVPEVGKFVLEPFPLEKGIRVCFLINDDEKKMSSEWEIEPSISNECYPEV